MSWNNVDGMQGKGGVGHLQISRMEGPASAAPSRR